MVWSLPRSHRLTFADDTESILMPPALESYLQLLHYFVMCAKQLHSKGDRREEAQFIP
jgi:hypothetical protein